MFFKITPYWKNRTKYWTSRTDRYRPIHRHHKPRNNQTKNETGIDADSSKDDTNQENNKIRNKTGICRHRKRRTKNKTKNPKRQNWSRRRQVYLQHTCQDNTNDYAFRIDTERSTYNTHTKTIPTIMCLESIQTGLLATHLPRQYQ